MPEDITKSTEIEKQLGGLLTPLSLRGLPVWLIYAASLFAFVYILNPTAGVFELIPDNLPFVGNLDEGVAFTLLWYGLVELFEGKKFRQPGR
ncbi:MAG: hypothetical protein ACP5HG_00025 [Anaerolineae bacterium]